MVAHTTEEALPVATAADRLPGLVAAGLNDAQIGRLLGHSRAWIGRLRQRAGLPRLRSAESQADVARRYNLPADLPFVQVRVLLALVGGPLTGPALADAVLPGRATPAYRRFNQPKRYGGNHLLALARRGLLARLPGVPSTYFLTLKALALLSRTESP